MLDIEWQNVLALTAHKGKYTCGTEQHYEKSDISELGTWRVNKSYDTNDLTIYLRVIKFLSVFRHLITDQFPYVFYHHRVLLQIPGSKQPQSLKTDDHNVTTMIHVLGRKHDHKRNFSVCPDTGCFLSRWTQSRLVHTYWFLAHRRNLAR